MHPELTNLLPASAVRALRRSYFLRVATVAIVLVLVVLVIHSVLLFPSYVRARGEAMQEQQELSMLSEKAASSGEKDANDRVAQIQSDVTYLGRLQGTATASGAVRAVLAVPHPGISLTGFTFTAGAGTTTPAQMTVTGTAATRDSLRQYALSLGELPYVSKADLPISSYAKESEIPFTVTLTGTLLP